MISRALRRALLDGAAPLPPTFLLPWSARLSTAAQSSPAAAPPPPQPLPTSKSSASRPKKTASGAIIPSQPAQPSPVSSVAAAVEPEPYSVSDSVRQLLPFLQGQAPHYITVHIHGFPYLVTQGDIVRLPFQMPDVQPGDVLRLNRAITLGSRDFTLGVPPPVRKFQDNLVLSAAEQRARAMAAAQMPAPVLASPAPHYIPHIAKGKHTYLDPRLFTCRATVVGVESEPMRFKEKTKRRQRHVRVIKSKHRYTILRIGELTVHGPEALEQPPARHQI